MPEAPGTATRPPTVPGAPARRRPSTPPPRHIPTPPTTTEVCMSRSSIPAQDPRLQVVVGWDNPLVTLFAQVFDPSIEEDEEACLLWIGTAPEAIPTVAALQAQLVGWATIPADIVDRLLHDQHAATPPTPLQRWVHQLLHSTGRPVQTVPNPQPEGCHALPSGHRQPPSSI